MRTFALSTAAFIALLFFEPALGNGTAQALGPSSPCRHVVVAQFTANGDDAAVGALYRFYILPEPGLALFTSFSGRFWKKSVLVPLGDNVWLQAKEQRYLWAGGLHEAVMFTDAFGAFAEGGAGYTSADYAGTARAPEEGWTPILRIGMLAHALGNTLRLEAAYRYADLRSAPENWFYFAVGAAF